MGKTFEQGKDEVAKLCKYFETNHRKYLEAGVKEAHVRQSLIDPFFQALGWDVNNSAMVAPQYREVIPEDSLEVEGQQKAPDYTFRVGTLPKFYAEAKKCGINIDKDPGPAYQLRRYGWSAKVALSLLTDFEEMAIYDCSMRPRQSDKSSRGRIMYLGFDEYPDRWRELWDVFSREAVWSGAYDQFAASKRKRGTSEVDSEFLKEIEGWRDELARNMALRNKRLSADDLSAAVQRTIDRIVFLRMAEDRGIEPYQQLLKLCKRPAIYRRLVRDLCRKADEKYNSGLFHFHPEAGISEAPDRITPKLMVDDKVMKPIIQSLYFEHGSPYHFGVLPVEILGTVYERFLGKVIRLTPAHYAKIEEKPEVRKAGGVYYTPSYIVDYIVKHTVGKIIEGKSPKQLAGIKGKPPFRVLDMACGSGSFLLGAYKYLLDHCLKWYIGHKPASHKKAVYKEPREGEWRLTIDEKKRILTTHIFGVDIDPQAVEVSKLSLLLKTLEGEDDASLTRQYMLVHLKRALPNLADNIKCGNSLIGPDYFTGRLIPDLHEMKRVNPFDWKQGFPDAMKGGGFDCVIGNPPYVRIQTLSPNEVEYLSSNYQTTKGNYDIYCPFLEKAVEILTPRGIASYILPHRFFKTDYGKGLRSFLSGERNVVQIIDFDGFMVFPEASINTCIIVLSRKAANTYKFCQVRFIRRNADEMRGVMERIARATKLNEPGLVCDQLPTRALGAEPWVFVLPYEQGLWRRMKGHQHATLGGISAQIFQGLKTGGDSVFSVHVLNAGKKVCSVHCARDDQIHKIETQLLFPQIKGGEMKRYYLAGTERAVIFPYQGGKLIASRVLEASFPMTWRYLKSHQKFLEARESGKMKGSGWYAYTRSQALSSMRQSKIVTPDYYAHASYAFDEDGRYFFFGGGAGGYGIVLKSGWDPRFIIGLLNSKLLDWFLRKISVRQYQTAFSYVKKYIEKLPIRLMDSENPKDKVAHDRMVSLVDSMLELHKRLGAAKSEAEKKVIQRQIDATDAEIDRLVYDLYSLTDAEIKIVEGEK